MPITFDPSKETFTMSRNSTNIYDYYAIHGFDFSNEIITRYVLSLLTKPFVILTGISGTGKTKIAQLFAHYIHQDKDQDELERYVAFVPVRPDWLDRKGLLGFYNILDEKYSAPPVLRLMLSAMDNPGIPHFVILDEMNLAKVEHYFSDFLSIMESRTPDRPQGEAIDLHDRKEARTVDGLLVPGRLHIPANVYFTGTVNVDESTYMFSPKVLDRSNVLEFNEVLMDGLGDSSEKQLNYQLAENDLVSKFAGTEKNRFCSRQDFEKCRSELPGFIDGLVTLFGILKKYNMHFGYRTINEISRFALLSRNHLTGFDPDPVLDIQILQKILPKFHGTQAKLESPLNDLFVFSCGRNEPYTAVNSIDVEKARFPRTAKKIKSMLLSLETQGYADFIE